MRLALVFAVLASTALGACGADDSGGTTTGSGGQSSGGTGGSGAAGGGTGGSGGTATGGAAGAAGGGGTAPCTTTAIEVAPNGTGDACSCAAPCALETGRDHARAKAPSMTSDVVVELQGGTYRLTKTFNLDATDSGQNGFQVVYRAKSGETPVLSGAVPVSGFTPVSGQSGVWVASVPVGTKSRQLWVDGRRATRARGALAPSGYAKTATGFSLGNAGIAAWPDRKQLEVVGTRAWKMFRCPVSDVTAGGVAVAEPCWSSTQKQAGVTFDTLGWLENALELLDEGGEFFLDPAAGKLFYMPRAGEDLAQAQVELPVLEELVHAEGTPAAPLHDLAFEGIRFAHATWLGPSTADGYASLQATITWRGTPLAPAKPLANVTLHATHAVRFSDCRFEHLGGAALALEVGAQGNVVENSRFEDVSASAVIVGDVTHEEDHHPKDPALIVKDNVIKGSYVTRAGAEYFDAPGLFVGYTTHTTIQNNELFDLPYTGISVGWGWGGVDPGGAGGYTTPSTSTNNQILNNTISYHMRGLLDGGAIYVLGAQAGSKMSGNVIDNQAGPYGNLYLDNGTQGFTVDQNVVRVYAKQDVPLPDPDRSYWLYVQVFDPVAKNNVVGVNFTNDATLHTPKPIDPSNSVATPTAISADPTTVDGILAKAGSALRSPVVSTGKPATASSEYDPGHSADQGNDGNGLNGWSPSGTDKNPFWQVDLGAPISIDAVEVVSRWALDQPVTRRSYRVIASADPSFTTPVVLGEVDATGIPHRAIFAAEVSPPVSARYVRVEKTAPEYFFLGEVRVHGKP